jgi:sulfite exporter TauE/SafE
MDCAAFVDDSLACLDRHEDQVRGINLMIERGILQAKRVSSGYARNAIFYFLVGGLFAGFGLLQYRFLGLQAVFFILIGLFLLYVAVANLVESKKYK